MHEIFKLAFFIGAGLYSFFVVSIISCAPLLEKFRADRRPISAELQSGLR